MLLLRGGAERGMVMLATARAASSTITKSYPLLQLKGGYGGRGKLWFYYIGKIRLCQQLITTTVWRGLIFFAAPTTVTIIGAAARDVVGFVGVQADFVIAIWSRERAGGDSFGFYGSGTVEY